MGSEFAPQVRLQNCSPGFPLIIPGCKLMSSTVCKQISALVSCCLSYKTWTVVKTRVWLARSSQPGAQQSQDLSSLPSMVSLHLHSQQAWTQDTVQAGSEIRSETCSAFFVSEAWARVFNFSNSRAKANRVLSREHTIHSKHPLPTTQEMTLHMDITRWSILKSDWL